jgi:hypothetical protein
VRYVHEDADFQQLVGIVATDRGLSRGLVEKDYWVTHTLWALHAAGFDVWFKGGTSLSKGFGLIERFSEDLDLKIEPGTVRGLPAVSNWRSDGTKATAERRAYFTRLAELLLVSGAAVDLDPVAVDPTWRNVNFRVAYPGLHLTELGVMSPFVRLEVGIARVTPFVERDMTSFVHDKLAALDQLTDFGDNRPRAVRCVHPFVTLLEKLEAIHLRFSKDSRPAASFVRHYEDAARIIAAEGTLPALPDYADVNALVADMLGQKPKQLVGRPTETAPAFTPADTTRWAEISKAHSDIAPMFRGARISIDEACRAIRGWIARLG